MTTFVENSSVADQLTSLASFVDSAENNKPKEGTASSSTQDPTPADSTDSSSSENTTKSEEPKDESNKASSAPLSAFVIKIRDTSKDSNLHSQAVLEILHSPQISSIYNRSDKDIEGFFTLLYAVLRRLPNTPTPRIEVTKAVLHVLTEAAPVKHKPQLRLRLLNLLYNVLLPSSSSSSNTNTNTSSRKGKQPKIQPQTQENPKNYEERIATLISIVTYANKSGQAEAVIPLFDRIADWINVWKDQSGGIIQADRVREVYVTMIEVLKTNYPIETYEMRVRYLRSFQGADNAKLSANELDVARACAIDAIKLPEIVESDHLLELDAIKNLEKHEPNLWKLLNLFAKDTLDEYEKWRSEEATSKKSWMESVGLVSDDCERKIKLLSLASLASQLGDEIPYGVVAGKLGLGKSEGEGGLVSGWEQDVERWVILGISAGIIDAKLDQLRKIVVINRAAQRVFTKVQWEQLDGKLGRWRESIGQLLTLIQSKKTPLGA